MGLGDVGKWLLDEAIMPAAEKMIPQGAAELGQALFTGNAYVAYGATNEPVSMGQESAVEAPSVGPAIEAPETGPAQSYDAMLQQTAAIEPPSQEQEMER